MQTKTDAQFLEDADMWPNWPVCPVKRSRSVIGWPECGCVFAGKSIVNMFNLPDAEGIKAAKQYVYGSMEALISDGWVVD